MKFLILLLNSVILCLFKDNISNDYYSKYKIAYTIITLFYFVEFLMNVRIFGAKNYLSRENIWHWILLLILLFYLSNILFTYLDDFIILNEQENIIRFFRFLLIISTIRLFKRIKALQKLLEVLYFSFPMIINIISVLLLVFFFYAMVACRWFSNFRDGTVLDDYVSFKNFFYSLMTMIGISTANNWTSILLAVVDIEDLIHQKDNPLVLGLIKFRDYIFFVSFMLVTFFFLINLFSLTLTKQFEESYMNRK